MSSAMLFCAVDPWTREYTVAKLVASMLMAVFAVLLFRQGASGDGRVPGDTGAIFGVALAAAALSVPYAMLWSLGRADVAGCEVPAVSLVGLIVMWVSPGIALACEAVLEGVARRRSRTRRARGIALVVALVLQLGSSVAFVAIGGW